MKRLAFKLLVFVLLGAIINVAIAWECAILQLRNRTAVSDLGEWPLGVPGNWPQKPESVHVTNQRGLTQTSAYAVRGLPNWHLCAKVESGLPARSLYAGGRWVAKQHQASIVLPDDYWRNGIVVSMHDVGANFQRKVLPLAPIWPGFAINTIFYAAIAWALFTVPGAVRRRVRIRRGQCASCGYSLRGSGGVSEKCPECGAAVGSYPTELRS